MALTGVQQVNLAATVDGERPPAQSPFPPCSIINNANPFPPSPSPVYTLLTQNIIGGPYPYTPSASNNNVKYGQAAIDVFYRVGSTEMTSTIIVTQSYATVFGAM